ncbi:MAG: DUF2325 domain-containing protein [Ruminococcus sp.]|nr:DUF2325 domain-containing protein [Ruminococcus sp.]
MSVVVVGGNDRMATRYKEICKQYDCKAKVFIKMPTNFDNQLGNPDLVVVFTNTVSHKMMTSVKQRAEKYDFPIARIHSASVSALKTVLKQYTENV